MSDPTASPVQNEQPSSQVWRPSASPWLVGIGLMLAAFMELLDTSIVNVALPHIA